MTAVDPMAGPVDEAAARGAFCASSRLTLLDHFRVPYEVDPELGGSVERPCPWHGGPAPLEHDASSWQIAGPGGFGGTGLVCGEELVNRSPGAIVVGSDHQGLSIVRRLGRRGVPVVVSMTSVRSAAILVV